MAASAAGYWCGNGSSRSCSTTCGSYPTWWARTSRLRWASSTARPCAPAAGRITAAIAAYTSCGVLAATNAAVTVCSAAVTL